MSRAESYYVILNKEKIKQNINSCNNILLKNLNELDYDKLLTAIGMIITRGPKNEHKQSNRMTQIFTPFIEELRRHKYNENQKIAIAFFLSRLIYLPQLDESNFSNTNTLKNNVEKMMNMDAININFNSNIKNSNLKKLVNSIIQNPIYSENKEMLFYLVLTFIKKFME